MLELGIGADLVRGIGLVLWGLLAVALLVALFKPKTITGKVLCSLLVLCIFFGPMVPGAIAAHEYRQKYEKAKALFDERCKTAGEKIYMTVENVEGVLLMKVRPERINFSDQYALDDPYGRDFGGDEYVASFLMGRSTDGAFTPNHTRGALKFVELITDKTALVARYYGQPTPRASQDVFDMKLKKSENQIPRAQYAINWRDLSTKEDRDYWIAGSVLEVIDLENKKLIAERIGYMFDSGLGTRNGGRSPWAYAEYNACPAFQKSAGGYPIKSSRSRDFILRVLKPIQGE